MRASEVMADAAALMNDAEQRKYTNTRLLPYLKRAYAVTERKLLDIGSRKLRTTSGDIQFEGQELNIINRDDNLLDDLITPIDLYRRNFDAYEKLANFTEYQSNIASAYNLIDNLVQDEAIYWEWQKGKFRFSKPVDLTLRIVYFSTLRPAGEVLSETSIVFFPELADFLTKQTAAYGAMFLMENPIRSSALQVEADSVWDDIETFEVKERQTESIKKRPFRNRRRFR